MIWVCLPSCRSMTMSQNEFNVGKRNWNAWVIKENIAGNFKFITFLSLSVFICDEQANERRKQPEKKVDTELIHIHAKHKPYSHTYTFISIFHSGIQTIKLKSLPVWHFEIWWVYETMDNRMEIECHFSESRKFYYTTDIWTSLFFLWQR